MHALSRITVLAMAATLGAAAVAAPAQPADVAQAFIEAWNSHEASTFNDLFTDDAEWVPVVETRLSGRTQIVADLQTAHGSWARRTTLAASDVVTSGISDSAAVVLLRAGFLGKDGKRVEPANALLLVVVKDASGWRIKAGQLSKPGATAMPTRP
ncbi:SgcJ/EcaC family oxidoreductase [Roseateles sp.]|uniref:SgcJ/EcaC family oxidoreductase n=1 Tax=Roseateles sp. TaxID=1971397 RepID=UPI002F4055FE